MNQKKTLFIKLELIWWLVTAIVIIVVLSPIYSKISTNYPFYKSNIIFIITFITFTRLIFLIKYSFLTYWEKIKIALILFSPIFIFFLISELNFFQTFFDERGAEEFLTGMSIPEQQALSKYIRNEMLFFGVGSVIAAIILPFRLIMSIWKTRNRYEI